MEMSGQKLIPESRGTVWKALNDPEILRSCVPGCQTLVKTSDTEMEATATIRVGPVSAKFSGKISLSELNEPVSYRITGEGQGGVAGFARGGAFISLEAALAIACVFAFLWVTGQPVTLPAPIASPVLSPEFGAGVQLILVAAVGYLFGRLSERRR